MIKIEDFCAQNSVASIRDSTNAACLEKYGSFKTFSKESARFSRLKIPGSKSISNRAILLGSLAQGISRLEGVLHCDDTKWMIQACRRLGAEITELDEETIVIKGLAGAFQPYEEPLYIGNSGTSARFLTAALVMGSGTYVLYGNERMHERPIADLLKTLRALGVKIQCLGAEDCLPLRVHSRPSLEGGKVCIRGDSSSQFTSALCMLAPLTKNGITIDIQGEGVSESYVAMTLSVMRSFGIDQPTLSPKCYAFAGRQSYCGTTFKIAADASSASYFFALAAISELEIVIPSLLAEPVQSDLGFVRVLEKMGCAVKFENGLVSVRGTKDLVGIEIDMCDMSDVVPTLAIVALFAQGSTRIHHVAHMRHKECDRISALCSELRRVGARVEEFQDGLLIDPLQSSPTEELVIRSYDDHRIAMAFAVLATRIPTLKIENPSCVAKTYPLFFTDLETVTQI